MFFSGFGIHRFYLFWKAILFSFIILNGLRLDKAILLFETLRGVEMFFIFLIEIG